MAKVWVCVKLNGNLISDIKAFDNFDKAKKEFISFLCSNGVLNNNVTEDDDFVLSRDYMHYMNSSDRHNPEIQIQSVEIQ